MVNILTTIIGITISLLAAICFNLGTILQKKGLKEGSEIKLDEGVRNLYNVFKEFSKNKYWLSGTLLGVFGLIPYTIAMGLVGIIIVQPLMSIGLIVFVISAIKILKEKISLIEIIAIALLIIAPILIGFAEITEIYINLYEFVLPFLIFFGVLFLLCVICYFISKNIMETKLEGFLNMFIGAILFSLGAVFTNILAQAVLEASIFPLFFWEIVLGIFWFEYLHLWAFIGFWGLMVFYILSIVFLQTALQKSKALIIIPIQNSIMLIVPLIAGIFVFHQSVNNFILFFIAIILILMSIPPLSKFQVELQKL